MSIYNKFETFVADLLAGWHDFSVDDIRVALVTAQPLSSQKLLTELDELPTGNGYTAGGLPANTVVLPHDGGFGLFATPVVFGAAGGPLGPFQHAVLYNASVTDGALIAWWEYANPITLADLEQFAVAFDVDNGIFKMI